jgi:O-antigen/teichoic acid export membrane protein
VVGSSVAYAALFLAMTVTGTLQILFDQVSMALRRGDQVFVRALLFGALTLGSLVVLTLATNSADSMAIVSPWVVGGAGLCLLGLAQLWRLAARYRYRPRIDLGIARRLFRVGVPNHLLTLTERAPGLILPIIVTERLSTGANAHWYTVWMMAWVIYIIPISVGIALFSELVHDPRSYGKSIRHGAQTSMAFGAVAAVGLALLASVALGFFGHGYAEEGTTPLRILVWGFIPLTFVQVYFATCRARQRLGEAITAGTVAGLVSVGVAYLVAPRYELTGMAIAWLATQVVAGAWALYRVRTMSSRAPEEAREEGGQPHPRAEVVPYMAPGHPAP